MLNSLIAASGHWQGTNILQDPTTGKAEESVSMATLTPLLGGRFVRLDYTWSYQGTPQEGSLLIGFDPAANLLSGHWIDSWHMSYQVLPLAGRPSGDAKLVLRGAYAAPPGPDWGWRIELAAAADSLRMLMYNHMPGDETGELAVDAVYRRGA